MNDPDPAFWTAVEAMVEAALQAPASDRTRLLDERCGGDPRLRAEVESLLASHARAGSFLDGSAMDASGPSGAASLSGRTIGAFRLLDRIGEGGMGVVYLAERVAGGFAQRVAVKLLDAPLREADGLRRFRAERQILASLNHPHIVALVDGAVTDEGQPYLVMEYVDGVPLTTYCAARALALEERLRLFQQVCAAVQDAHEHGVVHRDLKPGNILVTKDGLPKILDFGVAKLVDGAGGMDATATGLLRPLTPNYASPEQLRGLPVTTVSDIYTLGALLYELLAGIRCYDITRRSLDEILRVVLEKEPRRPSAAIAGTRLPYDRRRLKGDLDTIVLKAMAKDPARRYGSARELADDIGRHLAGRPVVARELSLGYTAAKLARRHRAAVVAATFSLVTLLAALAVSLWQTQIAVGERNRAQIEAAKARQVAGFLRTLFSSAYPRNRVPGARLTAEDLVASGVARVDELAAQPDVQASMLAILGAVYTEMGLYPQALPLVERSLALREKLLGHDHIDVAESLYTLGRLKGYLGEYEAARLDTERAVKIREAAGGPDDALLAEALSDLGSIYWRLGRPEGRQYLERAVAIEERRGGPQLSRWLTNLANFDLLADDHARARKLLERAMAAGARAEGEPGYLVNVTILNLGMLLLAEEDFPRARELLEQALEISYRLYGTEHQATVHNWGEQGRLYFEMGDRPTAREFLDRSISVGERILGPEHVGIAAPLSYTGRLLLAENRFRDASALFERVLRIRRKALGEEHASIAQSLTDTALATMRLSGAAAAESTLRQALAMQRRTLVPGHRDTVPTLTALGEALSAQGRLAEAEVFVAEAARIAREKLPPHHSKRVQAEKALRRFPSGSDSPALNRP
jgi:serine/threonine-protein kinase